jgi:nickel transport protein
MLLDSKLRLARRVALMVTALSIIVATALVSHVWAHKVNVFAWAEGDTIFVEGFYPGGKKSQNSLVEVFNPAGTKLLEGRTNNKGEFSFKVPEKTDLRIVLTDSTGHKDDFIVYANSPGGAGSLPSSVVAKKHSHSVEESVSVSADIHQLETIIDEALDRKLDPVIKLIRDTRKQGPSVTEIIGGIGYIMGLFGLVMYFKIRKKGTRHKAQGAGQNEKGAESKEQRA